MLLLSNINTYDIAATNNMVDIARARFDKALDLLIRYERYVLRSKPLHK